MGSLREFWSYVHGREAVIATVEGQLCALQEKYESFFAELAAVREKELQQLTAHIVGDRHSLPAWLGGALDKTEAEVARAFDDNLRQLQEKAKKLAQDAGAARELSAENEWTVRRRNVTLDREEEQLKERSSRLLVEIEQYNARIRALGGGFGFFSNLFKMRDLQAQRRQIEQTQADVAARIERLRQRWVEVEQEHAETESDLQQQWVTLQTDAAAMQTKLDYLEAAREKIIRRSTVEKVLYERCTAPATPGGDDPPCSRCGSPNPPSNHFCHICAQRLAEDRPDLHGSIEEIGEVNHHFQRFATGMQACQQIIGLVRGLKSGLQAFGLSVQSMVDSELRYPLAKLQIDVPEHSRAYGQIFDALAELVDQEASLHPKAFAEQMKALIEQQLTEEKIKTYFETMGQELSRQAEAQW